MSDFFKKPPAGRSDTPLWMMVAGLGVAVYSFAVKTETYSELMFWGGIVLAAIALVYWFANPKHGL